MGRGKKRRKSVFVTNIIKEEEQNAKTVVSFTSVSKTEVKPTSVV